MDDSNSRKDAIAFTIVRGCNAIVREWSIFHARGDENYRGCITGYSVGLRISSVLFIYHSRLLDLLEFLTRPKFPICMACCLFFNSTSDMSLIAANVCRQSAQRHSNQRRGVGGVEVF